MYSQIIFVVVALLSLLSPVLASGSAIVNNNCPFDVYLWSVGDTSTPMQTLSAGSGSWSEGYYSKTGGGGISIKIATAKNNAVCTQLEYTTGDVLWYDVSNVNGYPFEEHGLVLNTSSPACRSVSCPANVGTCQQAYTVWNDDYATAACDMSTDLILNLCTDIANKTGSASGSASHSSSLPASSASVAASSSAVSTSHYVSSTPVVQKQYQQSTSVGVSMVTIVNVVTVNAPVATTVAAHRRHLRHPHHRH